VPISVFEIFRNAFIKYPDQPALDVDGRTYAYKTLFKKSIQIAGHLYGFPDDQFVGILSYRSVSAYSGILGTLAAGKCYVPFNPKFPAERIRKIISLTGCRIFIADHEFLPMLPEIFAEHDHETVILMPETEAGQKPDFLKVTCITKDDLKTAEGAELPDAVSRDYAYLLFTSGTTGEPKGIPISHKNLLHYINYIQGRYKILPDDICTQLFDTTFDLSVHDLFVTWNAGAMLLVIPKNLVFTPLKLIRDKQATVWFSVPSAISILKNLRLLKKDSLPSLRLSFFCGEALPAGHARLWSEAAPNSRIVNLYGPTETTISISDYTWDPALQEDEYLNGIVPIGKFFPGHDYCLVDPDNMPVAATETGELCISGPQVASGYFRNEKKTNEAFIRIPGRSNALYYKTGDFVKENKDGNLQYVGRKDDQVQIRGFRVELMEVESILKKITGSGVAAIGWPVKDGLTEGIAVFIEGEEAKQDIIALCKEHLPDYMVPSRVSYIRQFPLNANGKTDRNSLLKILQNG
jgi:amino acid adenylation domain-containing protein